ncbi:Uu.00g062440.m01.CDS01 [Anthostomella pinea]|uniref:Uu.00g062440.m01.CDS01 n=1 Tax=Anthostomella pinea TaxID=933095 RepID=A0AAI8VTY5_9PEZI|nr:Uu.00g062440.m01.CDS01 [Anthostomella pinea]
MGLSDIPPPHAPEWLVPASTASLFIGVFFWDLTYILMTRRALQTRSYGMPLVGLAINVSWEIVYGLYVAENLLERLGFSLWLLLDLGLIYTTVRFAPEDWASTNRAVGRNVAWILGFMIVVGCWGHYAFASWFFSEPGMGSGDKTGKPWRGKDGYDTTELAFWSAGVAQLVLSADGLAMLIVRGHSGGTGFLIWLVINPFPYHYIALAPIYALTAESTSWGVMKGHRKETWLESDTSRFNWCIISGLPLAIYRKSDPE